MADDDINHSEIKLQAPPALAAEQTNVQAAAPAAPVNILCADLSSNSNHILATPLPHPVVIPKYDDIPDKLFGDIVDIIVHANNDLRITKFKTLPVPSPVPAPSPSPRPRTNLLGKKQSQILAIPRPMR